MVGRCYTATEKRRPYVEGEPVRFSSNDRMLQALFTLLFHGPANIMQLAKTITRYTGENADSVRVELHRCLPRLRNLLLITKAGDKWSYDITPLAFSILIRVDEPTPHFPIAVMHAVERRYPRLYKGFSLLLFACGFGCLSEDRGCELSDDYMDIELSYRDRELPEFNIRPKLDFILNNIHEFTENLDGIEDDFHSLLAFLHCPPPYDETCREVIERETECLVSSKCPCRTGLMCNLLERFDMQLIEQHYGVRINSPEAYYLFDTFEYSYHSYIEGCSINTLLLLSDFLEELGILTQNAITLEIEYRVLALVNINKLLKLYVERIIKNPFLISLEPIKIEDVEKSLKEALDYLNDIKSRIGKKKSED